MFKIYYHLRILHSSDEGILHLTFAIIWHTLDWIVHAPGKVGRQTFMNSDKDLATAGSTTN